MWATLIRAQNPACAWCHQTALGSGAEIAVKVYAHFPSADGRVWEEVEVTGPGWRAQVDALRARSSVHEISVLESTPEHARLRLLVDACPLPRAVAASGVLPRFPFEVRGGHDHWLLIGERDAATRFIAAIRDEKSEVEVVSMREYRPHASLTGRQRELMEAAIEQGYYEVPRRVTLTALAQRLHIAKSTLSETLARGERHVLEDLRNGGS